jgi:hypothetical protein
MLRYEKEIDIFINNDKNKKINSFANIELNKKIFSNEKINSILKFKYTNLENGINSFFDFLESNATLFKVNEQ